MPMILVDAIRTWMLLVYITLFAPAVGLFKCNTLFSDHSYYEKS